MKYRDKYKLRLAIESLAGKLEDSTWDMVKPENSPPYDRWDLLEICSMLRLGRRKEELKEASVKDG